MSSVSAIILTRNSERTIERCVKALLPAVDHVIVVDTGSTDGTETIAMASGARVYHFQWRDDFSAARNFGDSVAVTDWVIHVDSDEILRPEDTQKIRIRIAQAKKSTATVMYGVEVINEQPNETQIHIVARLFKRRSMTWHGVIHEQLVPRRGPIDAVQTDIGFIHDGYDPSRIKEKLERNIHLLEKGLEQEPNNTMYHFFAGREFMHLGNFNRAAHHLNTALMDTMSLGPLVQDAQAYLSRCIAMSNQ